MFLVEFGRMMAGPSPGMVNGPGVGANHQNGAPQNVLFYLPSNNQFNEASAHPNANNTSADHLSYMTSQSR